MLLSAAGLTPAEIAAAMEMGDSRAVEFCRDAEVPGSKTRRLIIAGRALGRAQSLEALQKSAASGDAQAFKVLQKAKRFNRFIEIVKKIDDDEFTIPTEQN